ncbi:hypothetical protein ACFQ9Q_24885 [Streptomyces virginiae]|uniref:hypothetical protein n=1 Tax=Streptomyces virginiae TaxID=1961 RepID=UPI00367E6A6F
MGSGPAQLGHGRRRGHRRLSGGVHTLAAKAFDDFLLKFVGSRITRDIGTPQERSYSFGPEVLRLVTIEEGLPFANFASPALPGLRPGAHTTTVFFRMALEHCDGAGIVREENCLPAGEIQYTGNTPFEVVKKRASAAG